MSASPPHEGETARPSVAVLIPAFNEETTIAQVVNNFRQHLPAARVYVFDNGSSDRTCERAENAGAIVRHEPRPGKGNVVRRMFSDVDAEVYVIVDGDATYDAASAPLLVSRLMEEQLDMVAAARCPKSQAAYRPGHRFGNHLLTKTVRRIFGGEFRDMLTGYRAFSKRFVKSFPALSSGFEIETELTVHALELRMPIAEIEAPYAARPHTSASKLHTYRDGWRILQTIIRLVKEERPLQFFSLLFWLLALGSVALAWPILTEYIETGLVPRFPTAILSSAMMLLAFVSLTSGFVLDSVLQGRRESRRMWYLLHGPPGGQGRAH